jgi:outer membrane immunogenic protein
MKRMLFAAAGMVALVAAMQPVAAADMPVKARPPAVAVFSWTGSYIGGNVGYSWGRSDTTAQFFDNTSGTLISTSSAEFDLNGWVAGGQIGHNWQSGNWVWGIEADFQWTGQDGDALFTCTPTTGTCVPTAVPAGTFTTAALSQSLDWFGTLRLRLGATVTPRVLAYVTGGFAYGHVDTDAVINGFTSGGAAIAAPFSYGETKAGWTIGGGIEGHVGGNWTAKIEYLYVDLGSVSGSGVCTLCGSPVIRARFDSDITDHIVRFGLNYKFGGPVVARY